MYVESVKLKNFRNYTNKTFMFKPGMNIILGSNGIGKTNLLESIYLLSTTRSHRNNDESEIIKFNEEFAAIEGIVNYQQKKDKVGIILQKKGKSLLVNDVLVKRNSEFIGKINAVLFSPADMDLFDSSPKDRRRLIDMELGKISSSYTYNLSQYLMCLKERNAYLKQPYIKKELLDTYTEKMCENQINIIKERYAFINLLNGYLSYFYSELSGEKCSLQMIYKSFIREKNDKNVMHDEIMKTYDVLYEKDVQLKQTNIGIHREDYEFYLDNINVAKFCSQGQKRMVILAIKLSLVQIIYQLKREYPILLLDDVFSELDEKHRICLLRLLPSSIQSIITTTDLREIGSIKSSDVNVLNMVKGVN